MAKESVENLCNKAQQAMAQGKNDAARQLYLQALSLKSDAPDVHYGLATVCFLLNDLRSAAYHFKEVTRLDPLRAGAHINLGAVYNRMDMLDEAIPAVRRGIQLDHNRAEGYYNLGVVYRRKGQLDLAIQAYREAVRINPRMSDAHYNIANIYLEKEQHGMALAHYKQALEVRPNWTKALNGLEQCEEILNPAANRGAIALATRTAIAEAEEPRPPAPPRESRPDPRRTIDPEKHGVSLTSLHKTTVDSDALGRKFLAIVEREVEPAIKDLSTCLLHPETSVQVLEQCLAKFESAIANMRNAQKNLDNSMKKAQKLGNQLVRT